MIFWKTLHNRTLVPGFQKNISLSSFLFQWDLHLSREVEVEVELELELELFLGQLGLSSEVHPSLEIFRLERNNEC